MILSAQPAKTWVDNESFTMPKGYMSAPICVINGKQHIAKTHQYHDLAKFFEEMRGKEYWLYCIVPGSRCDPVTGVITQYYVVRFSE